MKLKTLTTSLMISLLLGCGGINQTTTVQPAPTQKITRQFKTPAPPKAYEFDSVSFPQETCGDKLPDDTQAYPIELYPVFIEYSESNLQAVTSQFCRDAFKNFREKIGKDAIQVASFIGRKRANQFKNLLQQKLGSGQIGEPTVIDAMQSTLEQKTVESNSTLAQSPQSVGEAAKLTSAQVKELVSFDKNNSKNIEFKIILPTYIPYGFYLESFEINDLPNKIYTPSYILIYQNSSNSCFSINATSGGWGSGPSSDINVEVSSLALGKVFLTYTNFDRFYKGPYIGFSPAPIVKGKQGYFFNSPAKEKTCSSLPIQEAVKIVESLQYLNP